MLDPGSPTIVTENAGQLIERYRRRPAHCVYCANMPDTDEHPVGQSIGGRLKAPILCGHHNREAGEAVDAPMFARFAPVIAFLEVPRQDRQVGAPFSATFDDGSPVKVGIDGNLRSKALIPLEIQAVDDANKIKRAQGKLAILDRLQAAGKLADDGTNYIIAKVEMPPPINFELRADALTETAALKAALHYVAGFVRDIDPDVAAMLYPYVMGQTPAGYVYVRSLLWDQELVPYSWPPRHEITCYPGNDVTYVTVQFFDFCAYLVQLPFDAGIDRVLRYSQVLNERQPRFRDDLELRAIDWERDWTDADKDTFREYSSVWRRRLGQAAGLRDLRAHCRRAAERAQNRKEQMRMGFFECYESELHIEGLNPEFVRELVEVGRRLVHAGEPVWEVDVQVNLIP
jgi:hypothetical protein